MVYVNSTDIENLLDRAEYQVSRVQALRQWMEEGPARERVLDESTPEFAKKAVGLNELTPAADKPDISDVLLQDTAKAQFNFRRNNYTVKVNAHSVYQAGENYFVISANGTLSNEKEWLATTSQADRREFGMNNRGFLAHKYDIRFHIPSSSMIRTRFFDEEI